MSSAPSRNTHLAEALAWSRHEPIGWRAIAIGALGMVVPVAAGYALGKPHAGFMIGLGAMLLAGGSSPSETSAQERPSPGTAIAPAAVAVVVATLIAGTRWTSLAEILLAMIAALLSGYSRPLGVAAIRFIVYLVLSVSLLDNVQDHRGVAALIFGLGAFWNIAVRMMLVGRESPPAPAATPVRTPTPAQRRAYFRRTLQTLAGWQYTLRIGLGLTAASLLHHAWPDHHYGWIVVIVALLTQRPLEHVPIRITQRALGTLVGVAATWIALTEATSHWAMAILICLLAAVAPYARARSYLFYAAVSTPAILLVMDFEHPIERSLLIDRLVATLLAAAIVIAANVLLDLAIRVTGSELPAPRSRPQG